ncbi:MFS transporter [Microbispora sp. RL4-1S]|uniref:MFS transporter n=1 Tax=Microbispora oryzae TaxID=2806554 RepID=A0A940WN79_9ACTN|nr:MFS transporter [Microbispora oryzae]MBP2706128.1 MFS transporter [Microbispora oryzae]
MTHNSDARPGRTLAAVAVVQFMVSLDLSVVNVGLPRIAVGLGFSAMGLTWVIHAYALTFGGLLLLGGKAADRYGRRRVLLLGLGVFGLASLAGGFAQVPGHLVAARAVQGIGAAAVAPAALALLTTMFPTGRARVRAFGVWSAMNAAGGALGVLTGGLLTEYAGWRWVMFVNVPMAVCALALTWRGVAADPPAAPGGRPDVLGALLATAGMTLLVFGVVRTDRYAWTSPVTVTTLAVAAALLAAFVYVEQTTGRAPLIRLGLFANRSVAGANAYNLLVGAAMASAFYFVSLYLQRVLGTGPALTGVMFVPFALGVVGGSVLAVKLGYRLAPRTLLVAGGLLTATGFAWFGLVSPDGAFATDILGPSIVASVGFGLCLGPVVSTATAGVAPHETGTASGLLNSSRQIGASLGLAALGTVANNRTGPATTPEALNDGYALGLAVSAALLLVAVLIALTVLRRTSPCVAPASSGPVRRQSQSGQPVPAPRLVDEGAGGHEGDHGTVDQ